VNDDVAEMIRSYSGASEVTPLSDKTFLASIRGMQVTVEVIRGRNPNPRFRVVANTTATLAGGRRPNAR